MEISTSNGRYLINISLPPISIKEGLKLWEQKSKDV
jgi:hypothetical protein